jgi:hypothetical protein
MGFFNILLSIFSIISIVFQCFLDLCPQSMEISLIVLSSNTACRLLPFFSQIVNQMSSWLCILASLDRLFFILNYDPQNVTNNSQKPFNKTKIKLIMICIFFVLCVINIPNLFFKLDSHSCSANKALVFVRDVVYKGSYGVLPLIIQIVVSVILIKRVKKLQPIIHTASIRQEIKYTFSVIMFNMSFILSDIFASISIVFANIYGYNKETPLSTKRSIHSAFSSFAYLFSNYLNMFYMCVLLFAVNVITNKRFRREVAKMF